VKPAPFDYFAPTSVEEVVSLLAELGDEAKLLAGGQSLVPMLNLRLARFEALIDIGRVDALRRVDINSDGLTLGSMVAQCEVEDRPEIGAAAPLLAAAIPLIGHFQIRSRGTVGGSIAHADSAAECPAVAVALDAQLQLVSKSGARTVNAADFFLGMWDTVLAPDEILTSVTFPSWGAGAVFAVEEVARRHGDFAIAGTAVGLQVKNGKIDRAAIAMFGMGSTPLRAVDAEQAVLGLDIASIDTKGIGLLAVADMEPSEDLHASGALRRRVGATVVARALGRAIQEAGVA
jgi:carbon-monoxide dehydrogenase medium subunit